MATTLSKRPDTERPARPEPTPTSTDGREAPAVWWRVYRHHLRLLRNGAIAWISALTVISVGVVATFEDRYTTQAELEMFAELEGVPAFEAMLGRLVGLTTVEGGALSRWGMFGILAAVWGMLAAARLLRGAEDSGHLEPLRAGAIGRRGLLAAIVAALLTTHLVFAVAIGVTHSAAGMDATTSWALGAAAALLTASFAAASALASQLVGTYRRAIGLVGALLGLALAIRFVAAASGTPEWLWWVTPFGWLGYLHPLDGVQGAVVLAYIGLLGALLTAAFALANRDLHAAWLGDGGDEPRRAPRPVRSHLGLALRLAGASLRTWGSVLLGLAMMFGLLARDFSEAMADLPTMLEFADAAGWIAIDTSEGIVAFTFTWVAVILAVFAAGQAVAIREEEASWRIEHLMVRPVGRLRWLVTRVVVSAGAVALAAIAAGLGAWLGTSIVGSPVAFGDAMLAALNILPLAWTALGIGILLLGLLPRRTGAITYALVLTAYLLDFVGGMLELPEAVLDLSPFRHLAAVPATDLAVAPTLVMLVVALVATGIGVVAFGRRDLQEG